MANPVLTDKAFRAPATGAGWAAPPTSTRYGAGVGTGSDVMTMSGTVNATGILFAILMVGGIAGWRLTTPSTGRGAGIMIVAMLAALVFAVITSFKPHVARTTAPIYALLEGVALGAISKFYESTYNGIVVQALGATAAVFAVMLVLYKSRIIKVTDRFRKVVVGATMGLFLFYGVSLLLRLFNVNVPFLNSSSGGGIVFSLLVVGLAAFNLALDFDIIERGVQAGAPKYMEWYGGFGLMVTIVWLYLEMLRLLSKLNRR